MRFVSLLCLALVFGFGLRSIAFAQSQAQGVTQLESRVTKLEHKLAKIGNDKGPVLFLFGVFCALWAQNTGRNAWLWFFLGMLFSLIAVLFLLWKNANDFDRRRADAGPAT